MIKNITIVILSVCLLFAFSACYGESVNTETLNEEHLLTKVEAVEGTCQTVGNNEYYVCNECGKAFTDQTCAVETTAEEQAVTGGHQYDNTCDATCNVEGCEEKRFAFHMDLDGNEICDTCGDVLDTGSGGVIDLPNVGL